MKKIKLTQGKYALVDDKDFKWLNQWKWYFDNTVGYAKGWMDGKKMYMHRLILNTPKNLVTDHKNLNKLDNTRDNLRNVTRSQNCFNKSLLSKNISGHRGVYWDKQTNKWRVIIGINHKTINFGRFINKIDAILTYRKVIKKYYGEFINL